MCKRRGGGGRSSRPATSGGAPAGGVVPGTICRPLFCRRPYRSSRVDGARTHNKCVYIIHIYCVRVVQASNVLRARIRSTSDVFFSSPSPPPVGFMTKTLLCPLFLCPPPPVPVPFPSFPTSTRVAEMLQIFRRPRHEASLKTPRAMFSEIHLPSSTSGVLVQYAEFDLNRTRPIPREWGTGVKKRPGEIQYRQQETRRIRIRFLKQNRISQFKTRTNSVKYIFVF